MIQDINELRRLLASGAITESDLSGMAMSGSSTPQNALMQMMQEPQPNYDFRAPTMPQPQEPFPDQVSRSMPQPPAQEMQNFMRTETGPNAGSVVNLDFRGQQQQAPRNMKVAGYGGGIMSDLGSVDQGPPALDYSRPIEVPGRGKGFYAKDGSGAAYVQGPDGSLTKVLLGYDPNASYLRAKQDFDLKRSQADIEHTQEQTAASQQIRRDGRAPQIPSGYEPTATGLRPISGGPADFKQQGTYNADTATLQSSMADMDRLATSANEIANHKGLEGITGIQGAFPNIPGGAAADAEAKLNTLKSQVAFGVLQAMRNASKTGGALGNVSDAEGKRLEANLAALEKSQSADQIRESLGKIIEFSQGAKDRLANAYNIKYSNREGAQPATTQTQKSGRIELNAPPPASAYKGKIMTTPDGTRYLSDGRSWIKQ